MSRRRDEPASSLSVPRQEVADRATSLRRLQLDITRRLDGVLLGDHLGLLPGPGSQPAEARAYEPGDDVRRIDWNLSARTDRPHVRDTEADRELEAWALVDTSASLDFGTARWEKRDLAVTAVAAIGLLAARNGGRLGAVLHGGTDAVIPARTGEAAALALLGRLMATPRTPPGVPHTSTTLGDGIRRLDRIHRRRGMAIIVSDFLDPPDTWARALRMVALRHHTIAVEVVDQRELELAPVGLLHVVDPESGRLLEVQTGSAKLRARYAAAAAEQRAAIATAVRRSGARHLILRTDRDWLGDMVRFVTTARRRAQANAIVPGLGDGGLGGTSGPAGPAGSGGAGPGVLV